MLLPVGSIEPAYITPLATVVGPIATPSNGVAVCHSNAPVVGFSAPQEPPVTESPLANVYA